VSCAIRKLNGPSPASHLPGGQLNRPDARRVIPLKCAAHPGFKILLFPSQLAFRYEPEPLRSSPAHRPDGAQRFRATLISS
jgi:hypothetical protein